MKKITEKNIDTVKIGDVLFSKSRKEFMLITKIITKSNFYDERKTYIVYIPSRPKQIYNPNQIYAIYTKENLKKYYLL